MEKTMRKKNFLAIVVIMFCVMLLASCAEKNIGVAAEQVVQLDSRDSDDQVEESSDQMFSTPEPKKSSILEKYDDAKKVNSDVIGWIVVPNTMIDYPILLTDNNEFYIDHDLEKNSSKTGALFLDYRNSNESSRKHMIVYGHNMKNGTMFHDLNNFKNKDFFENNKTFTLLLFGKESQYQVVSEFIVSSDINFIRTDFSGGDDFVSFMQDLQFLRKFDSGYTPSPSDEIVTLSTCSYEYNSMRNVVQGLKIS